MPKTSSFAPEEPRSSMRVSSKGTNDSPPSRPNLFAPGYLAAKNFSSPYESTNLFNTCSFSSSEKLYGVGLPSILFKNQLLILLSMICMNS